MHGGILLYAAQAIPPFDAEIAGKGHLWTETSLTRFPSLWKIALWKKAITGNKKGACYIQESNRIEEIIQITLTDDVQKALQKSADAVKELVEVLKKLK